MMNHKSLLWIAFIFSIGVFPNLAQDFSDGLIAYTPYVNCAGYYANSIIIVDPNTDETVRIESPDVNIDSESLSWSANQRYLFYFTNDRKFHISDAQTGQEVGTIQFFRDETIWSRLTYDPHPTLPLILFSYISDFESETPTHHLYIFDILKQEWYPLAEDLQYILYSGIWSPDGKKILVRIRDVIGIRESDIVIIDIITQETKNLTNLPQFYGYTDWAKDSQHITYSIDGDIIILDIETGVADVVYTIEDFRVGGTEWALDDTALLIWTHDTLDDNDLKLYLLDLDTLELKLVLTVPPYFTGFDISPDGTAIVYLASVDHPKDVCILSLTTLEETCLDGEKAHMIAYPAWAN